MRRRGTSRKRQGPRNNRKIAQAVDSFRLLPAFADLFLTTVGSPKETMKRTSWAVLASAATFSVIAAGALIAPPAFAVPASSNDDVVAFDQGSAYVLTNVATGLVAGIPGNTKHEGALLKQSADKGTANQQWYLRPAGGDLFTVVNVNSGLVLDRFLDDKRGTAVGQWTANGQTNQQWTFEAVGDGTYEIRVKDSGQVLEVGANADEAAGVTVGTDESKPTQRWRFTALNPVTVTPTPSVAAGGTGWFTAPVSLTFPASANGATVQTRVQGTDTWSTTQPVRVSAEGTTVIEYRAVRNGSVAAGSRGTTEVKIDSVGPVASATTNPASGTVAAGGAVTAAFAATDATSGVDHLEYSIDGGTTWVRGNQASFTASGTYAVKYRAVDVAGNVGATKTVTLTVQAPVVAQKATPSITSADTSPLNDWYQKDVYVTLVAPQAGQKIQYRLYGSDWKNYTTPVKVARNGISTLDYRLVASGTPVARSEARLTIKVDKVVPAATATRNTASGIGTPRTPVSVSFVAKDLHSGVSKVEYRVNSGAWVTASAAPVVFDKVGAYTVSYRVTDVAGNVSAVRSVPVTIETK